MRFKIEDELVHVGSVLDLQRIKKIYKITKINDNSVLADINWPGTKKYSWTEIPKSVLDGYMKLDEFYNKYPEYLL